VIRVVDQLVRYHRVSDADAVGIQEDFQERAAIREHQGGFTRASAELFAIGDVEVTMRKVGTRPPRPPAPLRKAFTR
jgi:hypothetical protein